MTIPSTEGFLHGGSCLPCTPEEERDTVQALTREADENVKDGDLRYLVSQRLVRRFPCYFSPRIIFFSRWIASWLWELERRSCGSR